MKSVSVKKILAMLLCLSLMFSMVAFNVNVVSAAGTTYYVSMTDGNDNNDGVSASTPWKNLSKVTGKTFVPGDQILLKCGDQWNENVVLKGSGTPSSPIVFSSYGSGSKPKLTYAGDVIEIHNNDGWQIRNLEIYCSAQYPALGTLNQHKSGIWIHFDGTGPYQNGILIDGNTIHGYDNGSGFNSYRTDGVYIEGIYNSRSTEVARNIYVTNNLVYSFGETLLYIQGETLSQDNLTSPNLFKNVRFEHNVCYGSGNQGIILQTTNNSSIKWNVVHDTGLGSNPGWPPAGIWTLCSSYLDVKFNESYHNYHGGSALDATGIDIDWNCDHITAQYNYLHDNGGPGLEILSNEYPVVKNNKMMNNNIQGTQNFGEIAITGYSGGGSIAQGVRYATISDNLFYVGRNDRAGISMEPWGTNFHSNIASNNNFVIKSGLSGAKQYNKITPAYLSSDNNTFYTSSGSSFLGVANDTTYNSISSWRTATGYDTNTAQAVLDTTAPSQVSGLNGSTTSFSWNAASDSGSGVWHYNIYRSKDVAFTPAYSNMVGESTTTSFTDYEGVEANATYYYKVTAEDKCGNEGAVSNTITVVIGDGGPPPSPTPTPGPTSTPTPTPTPAPTTVPGTTFGNTAEGSSIDTISDSSGQYINLVKFTAASTMTVNQMQAKVVGYTGKYKCAIYSDNGGNPNTKLAESSEVTNPSTGWQTFTIPSTSLTSGNSYWLAIWGSTNGASVYYSDTAGTLRWSDATAYGSWPSPLATTGGSSYKYCIYAVAVGGATATPAPTATATPVPTATATPAPTATATPAPTATATPAPTATATPVPTATATPAPTATATPAPTATPTPVSGAYIGRNTVGSSNNSSAANDLNAFRFTAGSNMTVTQMKVYLANSLTGHMKLAIYSHDSANNRPNALLKATAEITNPVAGWNTFTLTSSQALTSGTTYWLVEWADVAYTTKTDTSTGVARSTANSPTYSSTWPSGSLIGAGPWVCTDSIYAQ